VPRTKLLLVSSSIVKSVWLPLLKKGPNSKKVTRNGQILRFWLKKKGQNLQKQLKKVSKIIFSHRQTESFENQ
jgi:hypothetical protein